MTNLNGNGNSLTLIGIIATIIGCVFTILNTRMDFIQTQIIDQKHLNDKFEEADKLSLTDRSEMKIKFTEVETQFRWLREISDKNDEILGERLDKLEKKEI